MSRSSPALALIQPLLDEGKRPFTQRFRAFVWLVRRMGSAVPLPFALWLVIIVLQGLMPPFQLWASGKLVGSIEAELDGAAANPWGWTAAMVIALAGTRLLDPLRNWAAAAIMERGIPSVQGDVLGAVIGVDLEMLEHQGFYDVTRRIASEARTSLQQSLSAARDMVVNIIPLVGAILLIVAIDWRLMLVLMLPLIPMLLEALRQGGHVWDALRGQTHERRIAQYIADRFSDRQSAKEIRLFGLADELIKRWQHHYMATRKEMRGKTTKAALRMQLRGTWADLIIYGGLIWLVTGGLVDITPAEITVLMGAFMTSGNQSFALQQAFMDIGNHGGFAGDVRRLLALPTPFRGAPAGHAERKMDDITLENVTFAYPGTEANVVDGMSLTIPAGQTVAIVGENGAGKTTLLKLILGLYQPTAGRVLLGGTPISDIPLEQRMVRLAAVFQTFSRYPLTVTENITLPLSDDDGRLSEVVTEAGLDGMVADAPDGMETILSPDLGGVDLSGGQWQRVAIARAGYRDADVLALDEPTAALDPLAEVDVFRRFAQLSSDRTTLLISHRLGMARLADRIVVIEHGKVTEDGAHGELLRNGGHYAELWEMQSRWYQ